MRVGQLNVGIKIIFTVAIFALLSGCTSAKIKARKEEREKLSQVAHLYCDFINGEVYPDVEVQLNLEMAKRCDSEKSMTVTNYRSPSDNIGLVYCCSSKEDVAPPPHKGH